MRNRELSFILAICFLFSMILIITACDSKTTKPEPEKLEVPVVVLKDNIAVWSANEKADKFEVSVNGKLFLYENTVTEMHLNYGETIKVRAVGDGISTLTSDWSNSETCYFDLPCAPPA